MTKERLRNYQNIKRERVQLEEKLAQIEANLFSPKIPQLTGTPPSGSPTGSAMENLADKHMELQRRYEAKLVELAAEQLEIERAIETLDTTARLVLRYHYIDGLIWEDVAVRAHHSLRTVHNIHSRALQELKGMEG